MEWKKGSESSGQKPRRVRMEVGSDPVRNFEKWKKKYNRTKVRVKRERDTRRPEWHVERDYIAGLVRRYEDINTKEVVKFSDFPISKKTLLGLQEAQYRQPTDIQRSTVGLALRGRDVLGAAKTGSGKTLAFLIPVLERLYRLQWTSVDGLGALIISPTRELAYQTYEVLRKVGRNHELSAGLVIGGKDLEAEADRIHRTNIVVCTPGRLLQHMDQTAAFTASDLQVLVLDEADRILDLGFSDTLNAILENLPPDRQTLLFSATQTKSVKALARLSLKDPEYVWVHEKARFSTPGTLEQSYVVCELHHKVDLLFSFIRSHLKRKIIVFFACCKEVQFLFRVFCRLRPGLPILALHGKQPQMKRVEVYNDFLKKNNAVLFATDVAARGLDFPAVHWVLQFDCPEDANTYVHRVGRTARYQQGGEGLLLLLPSEEGGMITQLQAKKVPINKIQVNPEKLQSVQQKLEAFLAQEKEQKERAQRCFVSYLRSVYLMKNKEVFDVSKLHLQDYARSLGLAVAPRVRFLHKAPAHGVQRAAREEKEEQSEDEAQPSEDEAQPSEDEEEPSEDEEQESEEEEQLRKFQATMKGHLPGKDRTSSDDEDKPQAKTRFKGEDEEEDEDLKDLDLLIVKKKDVFNLTGEQQEGEEEEEEQQHHQQKSERETKYSQAKKVLKRNFQINTKVTFSEQGDAVQLWPPIQRSSAHQEEQQEEEEASGINLDKARERLRREDQEFDKQEYRNKVKAKHREKRLKEKEARREASRRRSQQEEEEEDEVVAYLNNSSGDEFDPSSLPDPDKQEEEGEGEREREEVRPVKRQHSSEDSEEEAGRRKSVRREEAGRRRKSVMEEEEDSDCPLDTGLSLVEDEQLVLQLLAGRR